MVATVSQAQGASGVSLSGASGNCNVQMAFAMLQMSMGQTMKENAMGYIEDIKAAQEQAKQISEQITKLRNLKTQIGSSEYKDLTSVSQIDAKISKINEKLKMYDGFKNTSMWAGVLKKNATELESQKAGLESYKSSINSAISTIKGMGIDTSGLEKNFTADSIQTVIENLQSKSETATASIQQQMVFVQDYIGQYNSYVQGASSAISAANQTLTNIARGQ